MSRVWARFLIGFPHYAWTAAVSPLRLHWVKSVCMFRYNLPPALLAEWPGSFTCHCGNEGVERAPNKSQHTKLTLENKVLQPLLPRYELATFQSPIQCSNQQAIPAPTCEIACINTCAHVKDPVIHVIIIIMDISIVRNLQLLKVRAQCLFREGKNLHTYKSVNKNVKIYKQSTTDYLNCHNKDNHTVYKKKKHNGNKNKQYAYTSILSNRHVHYQTMSEFGGLWKHPNTWHSPWVGGATLSPLAFPRVS